VGITWDPNKNAKNIRERGIGFDRFRDLDDASALMSPSPRHGEARTLVLGFIDNVLHAAVTLARGENTHVISLRRASRQERKRYDAHVSQSSPPDSTR
jgi:uncharacterized DUF497 family protein